MDQPDKSSEDPSPTDVAVALGLMMSSTPAAVVVLRQGLITYSNPAADQLLGSSTSVVGRAAWDVVHPREMRDLRRRLVLHGRRRFQMPPTSFELDVIREDGRVIRVESLAHTIDCNGERVIGLICCDVTARAAREVEWERAATHDSLTGLPNRVLLIERLQSSMSRLGRNCARVMVMMLDLDGFKSVNDTYGHAAGDRLLQEVAVRLRGSLRAGDTVARLAGDEFVICAELGHSLPGEAVVLRRVEEALAIGFEIDGNTVDLSAGIGVLTFDEPRDVHGVIDEVDRRMYRQKQSTRANQRPSGPTGRSRRHIPTQGSVHDTVPSQVINGG